MSEKNKLNLDVSEDVEMLLGTTEYTDIITTALEKARHNTPQFLSTTITFKNLDPLAVLETCGNEAGFRYFWEHPDREISIAASGKVAVFKSKGLHRMHSLKKKIEAFKSKSHSYSKFKHSLAGPFFLGGASFSEKPGVGVWNEFGNSSFTVPEWVFTRNGKLSLLTLTIEVTGEDTTNSVLERIEEQITAFDQKVKENITDCDYFPDTFETSSKTSNTNFNTDLEFKLWTDNIESAKDLIKNNVFEKIVLAREKRIQTEENVSATRFLHILRKEYPSCYTFMHQVNDKSIFLGSTPEKLISLEGKFLQTEALAGSISRGKTATQDALLENRLQNSSKDLEEHSYVVEAIQDKLKPYTPDIDVAKNPIIRKYSNVQHLYTAISASVSSEIFPLDLVNQLHPTPAVGGYPQESALPYIQELEQFDRGWYAGPIGWFNTNNRAEFSVALRCGLIQKNKIRFFAGCGIVEDSDPISEWEETKLKFMPMLNALKHATK